MTSAAVELWRPLNVGVHHLTNSIPLLWQTRNVCVPEFLQTCRQNTMCKPQSVQWLLRCANFCKRTAFNNPDAGSNSSKQELFKQRHPALGTAICGRIRNRPALPSSPTTRTTLLSSAVCLSTSSVLAVHVVTGPLGTGSSILQLPACETSSTWCRCGTMTTAGVTMTSLHLTRLPNPPRCVQN